MSGLRTVRSPEAQICRAVPSAWVPVQEVAESQYPSQLAAQAQQQP